MRSSRRARHLPLEARLSVAVAVVVALALAAIGLLVVARIHDRVAARAGPSLARTLSAALPALQRGEVPSVPGTRLAWIDGDAAGGDADLIAAARAGTRVRPRYGRGTAERARDACSPSRGSRTCSTATSC